MRKFSTVFIKGEIKTGSWMDGFLSCQYYHKRTMAAHRVTGCFVLFNIYIKQFKNDDSIRIRVVHLLIE